MAKEAKAFNRRVWVCNHFKEITMNAEFEKTNRIKLPQSGVEIELIETTDKDPCAKCVCRFNKECCIRGEYMALTCLIQSKPSHWKTVETPEKP